MLSGKAQSEQRQPAFPEEGWLTRLVQRALYPGRWPSSGIAPFCPPPPPDLLLGLPCDKDHLTVELLFPPGDSDSLLGQGCWVFRSLVQVRMALWASLIMPQVTHSTCHLSDGLHLHCQPLREVYPWAGQQHPHPLSNLLR